ncbi:FtsH protease activity modulator HflK [Teredinibacter turnerae]|uniref:FtsH protease activity modulator HflK n=1 Tax=Teredinibacter turnerae TaxID=2426 RepID=UPI0005F883EE|nr:FtsH protease activity modulator HflK [Teredinibacter turnerae]
MAWNEPGGNKDPWGGGNRGNNDGPPDLDEALKNLQKTLGGLFGGKKAGNTGGNSGGTSGFGWTLVALALIALLLIYGFMGAGIVNEQERAVVLRLGVYNQTLEPGFRWNPPLIDKVYPVNVTKVRQWSTSEQMLTKDLNIVDIKLSVQYIINDAQEFVLRVRDPESSLKQATNSALRHVAGSTLMHDILTEGRERVAYEIQDRLQAYLNAYQTGISVEKVNIEDSNPPREVQDAFDDVIKAREDEERYKNQAQTYANGILPEARGAAQRVIEEATAYKEQVIAKAEGEAKRFEYLLNEYKKSPEVTRQRLYLDAVEDVMSNASKVLVDVEGGNNMLYLPLDKIINTSQQATSRGLSSSEMDQVVNDVMDQLRREAAINSRRREGR